MDHFRFEDRYCFPVGKEGYEDSCVAHAIQAAIVDMITGRGDPGELRKIERLFPIWHDIYRNNVRGNGILFAYQMLVPWGIGCHSVSLSRFSRESDICSYKDLGIPIYQYESIDFLSTDFNALVITRNPEGRTHLFYYSNNLLYGGAAARYHMGPEDKILEVAELGWINQ